jgi:hypothetical protein
VRKVTGTYEVLAKMVREDAFGSVLMKSSLLVVTRPHRRYCSFGDREGNRANLWITIFINAAVAQRIEHRSSEPSVGSSNLSSRTKKR